MQFEYEITAEDYVACQLLYYKSTVGNKRIWKRALWWIAIGFVLILAACNAPDVSWAPVLLAIVGAVWVYGGIRTLLPARYFRRHYSGTKLRGKKFKATVSEEGINVSGEFTQWIVKWNGVIFRAENNKAFIVTDEAAATIFMFGNVAVLGGLSLPMLHAKRLTS